MTATYFSLQLPVFFFSGCFQNRKIKKCQGCQDREVVIQRIYDQTNSLQEDLRLDSYKLRRDIKSAHFIEHCYKVSMRQGVMVKHCDNHKKCYNYILETNAFLLVKTKTKEIDFQKCPGHEFLLGYFFFKNKANNEGLDAKKRILRKVNIEQAKYSIIEKNSKEAKERKCFSGLDRIKNYAVYVLYHHFDGSLACASNRAK